MTKHKTWRFGILLITLFFLHPGISYAAGGCTVSANGVNFGTYNPFSGSSDTSNGTVSVSCKCQYGFFCYIFSQTYNYTIDLSQGRSGSYAQRTMENGSYLLAYQLYSNSSYTAVWGNGTGGTSTVSGTCQTIGNTCTNSNTIYGEIPAPQTNVAPGNYSDTITVTVSY